MDISPTIEKTSKSHILHTEKANNSKYYHDLQKVISILEKGIEYRDFIHIVKDKLQLGKSIFNYKQYIQSAAEITVVAYFLDLSPNSFRYEPKLNINSNKNVECQITHHGIKYNIEVKTPEYSTQEKQNDSSSIKIKSYGRYDNYQEISDHLKPFFNNQSKNLYNGKGAIDKKRMDLNAKDYLIQSQEKFPKEADRENYNILIFCLDDADSIEDWYGYFTNYQGFFTKQSFIPHSKFDKVDSVVFTNLYYKHNRRKKQSNDSWSFPSSFNLNVPNRYAFLQKYEAATNADAIIPNYTRDYIQYLKVNDPFIMPLKHFIFDELQNKKKIKLF